MKTKVKDYLIILIFALLVSVPLVSEKLDIYRDDGIQHIARLMGTYQSIEENQTIPVIMSNFCNGFGYSWNIFYSPFTAYVPMIFRLFTDSYETILKLFMILISYFSGIAMYEFTTKVTKNRYAGLLSSVLYIFAPYRLTDMYIRVAISELASFIFLPITFLGIYNIFNYNERKINEINTNEKISEKINMKSSLALTLGAVGLILTHIVMAMYTAIFCLAYLIVNIKKLRNINILKMLGLNIILIILLSGFYIFPMLEHRINVDYEVFKEGRMENDETIISSKTDLIDLIYTENGQLIKEVGIITIVGLGLTFLAIKKVEQNNRPIYIFSLCIGLICIFLTLKIFPFEKLPSVLKMIQFTFRLFEFSTFFLVFVTAVNYSAVIRNYNMKDVVVLSTICILLTIPYIKYFDFQKDWNEEKLWPAVEVNNYTGRVHAGCATFEYLPCKAYANMDYLKHRENTIYILEGYANIENEKKTGTNMQFEISDVKDNTILELPYIYYLGYEVTYEPYEENMNSKKYEKIKVSESDNGFVQINLPEEAEGRFTVKYTGTVLMKMSYTISIITFIFIIILLWYNRILKNKI